MPYVTRIMRQKQFWQNFAEIAENWTLYSLQEAQQYMMLSYRIIPYHILNQVYTLILIFGTHFSAEVGIR